MSITPILYRSHGACHLSQSRSSGGFITSTAAPTRTYFEYRSTQNEYLFGSHPPEVYLRTSCYQNIPSGLNPTFHPSPVLFRAIGWSFLCCTCHHIAIARYTPEVTVSFGGLTGVGSFLKKPKFPATDRHRDQQNSFFKEQNMETFGF